MSGRNRPTAGRPWSRSSPRRSSRPRSMAWARRIGVEPKEVHIRPMSRKWGSCSTAGRLDPGFGAADESAELPQASDRARAAPPEGSQSWEAVQGAAEGLSG